VEQPTTNWQPSADLAQLQARADLLQNIRDFFAQRQVLEVQTPILARQAIPETHIDLFSTDYHGPNPGKLYLQASPEAAMKRLLVAGSGAIYQITPAFRNSEAGRTHNPEFTLLEWYRPDFDHHDLMMEVEALLRLVLPNLTVAERISYNDLLLRHTGLHPLQTPLKELQKSLTQLKIGLDSSSLDRDTCLDILITEKVCPALHDTPVLFVYDYPASQASLARLSAQDPNLAARFEVFVNGMELANGFQELSNASQQRQRFEKVQQQKRQQQADIVPTDQRFLAALEAGLPNCAGVALGIERLLMLQNQVDHIAKVCSFSIDHV